MALEARAEVLCEFGGSRCEGDSGGDQVLFLVLSRGQDRASTLG